MNNIKFNKNDNDSSLYLKQESGFPYLSFKKLEDLNIVKHIITTRLGGHSKGVYSTFNTAFNSGDNKEDVYSNFNILAKLFNTSLDNFYHGYQEHTANIKIVKDSDRGKGVVKERDEGFYDGFITNQKGLVLYVTIADCVPILIVDKKNVAIAAVHAGWRGTLNNIVKNAITKMKEEYNTNEKDIIACIGPSICKDCYEVSYDLYYEFSKIYDNEYINKIFKEKSNKKYNLDLWKANYLNLVSLGVNENNIDISNICTYNNPELLFSHRRMGTKRGNMGAFIMIL